MHLSTHDIGVLCIGIGIGWLLGYAVAWFIAGYMAAKQYDIDAAERRRRSDLTRALGRESLPTGQTGPPSNIRPADMRAARIDDGS